MLVGPDGPVGGKASQRHRIGLVALLSVAPPHGLPRERLGHLLWPEAGSDKAQRRLLSDSIYRLNRAIGAEALQTAGEAVRLDLELLPSDVGEFADAMAAEDWKRAVEVQHAPFLDGFSLPSGPFEQWQDATRRQLHRDRQVALEALATSAEGNDPASSVHWWRTLAAGDRFSSRSALGLMRALAAQGDRAAAVRHAQAHTALVREELGLEPDADVALYAEQLRTSPELSLVTDTEPPLDTGTAGSHAPDRIPKALHDARSVVADQTRVVTKAQPRELGGLPRRFLAMGTLVALVVAVGLQVGSRDRPATPAGATSSIVVLPFADNSPDADQEYFADGMTDELINQLSAVDGLRVVARTSAFAFKGRSVDVREVGRQLSVGAVLEGSVQLAGDRLRVSAQLIGAEDGFEMWSETYERELTDVLDIQSDIAGRIVDRLVAGSTVAVPAATLSTSDAEAFNLYLRGRFEWHKRSAQGLERSVELFEEAVEKAPDFARAHAGLADAYAVLGFYDYLAPGEAFPKATAGARRAMELDARLAEPHATLGYTALYYDWDAIEAERSFRRGIELNPGYSTGHQWYANLLVASARFEESERHMRIAQELDPLSRIASAALAFVHYHADEPARAREQLEQTLELDPDFELAHLWLGWVFEEQEQYADAVKSYERAAALSGSAIARATLARGLALSGNETRARELLRALEAEAEQGYAPTYEMAKVYEALGDRDATLSMLARAFRERSHSMVFLAIDPQLRRLRSDPEFAALVAQVPVAEIARERVGW